ncbi:MAG: flagellar protein export ATPase FliI [Pseudomonadales bacterium]|nr:flagellar protein export ATPase FliI [Pseudomonadales bacterium]
MTRIELTDRIVSNHNRQVESIRPSVEGRLTRMVGLTLEAVGFEAYVGECCTIESRDGSLVQAEVVGFADKKIFLMPVEHAEGLQPGAKVAPLANLSQILVGDELLGRVLDGRGEPLDGLGPVAGGARVSLEAKTINPLQRRIVSEPMDVGIRAINAMITMGKGQRIGLFAGSGVGKSMLLGMMTRYTEADVTVVGLIGERGREVKEFIESSLGEEGLKKSVIVAAPADDTPLMRLRAAQLATRVAEYFRDQGKNVLLLMDSLSRYAQAQREIALAVGEPPATKGYPPSVFAKLPQLVERAGNGAEGGGSITAVYTILAEGDDLQDPVVDAARAILDGHVVLSRTLADAGHYPAIDIGASVSRVMSSVVGPEHMSAAIKLKKRYSKYQQVKDLVSVGAYAHGQDPETDLSIQQMPMIEQFLQQSLNQAVSFDQSSNQIQQMMADVSMGSESVA